MNPYEQLDVPRDATPDEIKKAYKKRAKSTHPDTGGSHEAFTNTATALAVLSDPRRRDHYDRTGTIDDDKPDNDRAGALQIIETLLSQVFADYVNGTAKEGEDPRTFDIPAALVFTLEEANEKAHAEIRRIRGCATRLKDLAGRFSVKRSRKQKGGDIDPIGRSLARQIAACDDQIAEAERLMRSHNIAIEIARGYSFEKLDPFEQMVAEYTPGFRLRK